jgi:hypothetical protein
LNKFKYILSYIFLFYQLHLFGQRDSSNVKKFQFAPNCGYIWQGSHNFDFGIQPMVLLDAYHSHSNIGVMISGNLLLYNKSTYLSPTVKFRIMKHYENKYGRIGWSASIGHSYTNIRSKYDHRITPEVGVKWTGFDLTVGYNFPVSSYRDDFTSYLRVGFRFNPF